LLQNVKVSWSLYVAYNFDIQNPAFVRGAYWWVSRSSEDKEQ